MYVYDHDTQVTFLLDDRVAVVDVPDHFCPGCGWNLDNDDAGFCGCDFM